MRKRNYATPEVKAHFNVGQDEFSLAVTEGHNAGERSLREYWVYYRDETGFEWKWATLLDGATIIGKSICETVLSDNELFLHRLRDDSLLVCSHYNRHTVTEYFAICVDRNKDTHYGIYNGENGKFTAIFDVLLEIVRSKPQHEEKEN